MNQFHRRIKLGQDQTLGTKCPQKIQNFARSSICKHRLYGTDESLARINMAFNGFWFGPAWFSSNPYFPNLAMSIKIAKIVTIKPRYLTTKQRLNH